MGYSLKFLRRNDYVFVEGQDPSGDLYEYKPKKDGDFDLFEKKKIDVEDLKRIGNMPLADAVKKGSKDEKRISICDSSFRNKFLACTNYQYDVHLDSFSGKYLTRYISVYQLLDILTSKKITFTSLELASDKLERLTRQQISSVDWPDKSEQKRQLNEFIKENCEKEKQFRTYISCWYLNKSKDFENIQMWNNYAKSEGVQICFKFDALRGMLQQNFDNIIHKNDNSRAISIFADKVHYFSLGKKIEKKKPTHLLLDLTN